MRICNGHNHGAGFCGTVLIYPQAMPNLVALLFGNQKLQEQMGVRVEVVSDPPGGAACTETGQRAEKQADSCEADSASLVESD